MASGKLSSESPVAQALLGTALGEVAVVETPRGARRLRVERLGWRWLASSVTALAAFSCRLSSGSWRCR